MSNYKPKHSRSKSYEQQSPQMSKEEYRIKKEQEVLDIGYEDYVYSGNVCFMEWPELIEGLLPADVVKVTIQEEEDGGRTIRF